MSPEALMLQSLRRFTSARVALGRCGNGLPTHEVLDFRLAHARAKDAVQAPANLADLAQKLLPLGLASHQLESAASTRHQYLSRPDLGRRLSHTSREYLLQHAALRRKTSQPHLPLDLALVICDGLSCKGVEAWTESLLAYFLPMLQGVALSISDAMLVQNGRVAIGDEIGHALGARMSIVLIGERPGLGSPDSLGIYLTHNPIPGTTDEARNCISNVRMEGLAPMIAAHKLFWLCSEALQKGLTGTQLKDESPEFSLALESDHLPAEFTTTIC